jgi:rhodanese-related sulfurtransferase
MKRLSFLLIFSLLAAAVSTQAQEVLAPADFAQKLRDTPRPQLLDVRTPAEFNAGHLPQARNADWRNFETSARHVARLDKTRPIFVYCQAGVRSKAAADWLARQGFRPVYDLRGGFRDWTGEKEASGTALPKTEKP